MLRTLIDKYVINATKGKLFCCFVDFQKAFDSIWHEGLFLKLLNNKIGGSFYRLVSDMYSKSQCAIRYGDQRTNFFKFNRGVRQGCILSPILFNLYLNELPHILDSQDTDPVTLPNGLPLNCLLYADDLVLISRSAAGLQNQINLLHKYSEKWLLTTNLKKTKTVIFQKQNRKSTREKYLFFLNRNEISNATEYTYLGTTFYSNGNFSISKQRLVEKTRRSIFACKKYLDFNRLPISMCNKLFDSLFLPILLYSSEVWGAYDKIDLSKWEKDPIEKQHTQFYKYYIGLNRRAPNVVSRNEVGRLPLKLHVYMRMLKFWTHLENLPDNSIAKQCLHLSAQLAEHKKPSFIFSLREILQQYGCMNQNQDQFIGTTMDYNGQKIKNYLPKIKQTIMTSLKNHQHNAIRSNRKLQFYSIFKTDQRSSLQLELIKNANHRQSVAKLRCGNHDLKIETGRHCVPKIPESMRICSHCSSNEVENEIHFVFHCNLHEQLRKTLFNDIILKYPEFGSLNEQNKILFLFNNIDPYICKKLGYFIFEAFQKRKRKT